MKVKILLIVLFCLAFASFAHASEVRTNTMTLLAVKETSQGMVGGTAELTIEVREGSGRVFVETSPLTKIDTQVSTRFAKEIACNFLEIRCNNLDFIYTLKSDAPIIGGPSAGAAMSVITIATLKDVALDKKTAITGTINSGGLIGPVGGVKEKIDAAKAFGLKKVLVPAGETIKLEGTNVSLTPEEYGEHKGIDVKEVGTLNDAFFGFTGIKLKEDSLKDVEIDEEYTEIMKKVALNLCNRTEEIASVVELGNESKDVQLRINTSRRLFERNDYYSAASQCFSANIKLNNIANKGISEDLLMSKLNVLKAKISDYDRNVSSRELKTIPELQTFMIVKERIGEAEEYYNRSVDALNNNESEEAVAFYAYSEERLNSAVTWSEFFNKKGKEINISRDVLKNSCQEKISEAEDRLQYVTALYPVSMNGIQKQIDNAKKEYENGEYAVCLNSASLAKADSDSIISSIGVEDDEAVKKVIAQKLKIAKENIIKEQERGFFPIAGYSYYEYSRNMMNESVFSSLIFSQYALELSSFDVYFEKNSQITIEKETTSDKGKYELVLVYAIGIITGVILSYMVVMRNIR